MRKTKVNLIKILAIICILSSILSAVILLIDTRLSSAVAFGYDETEHQQDDDVENSDDMISLLSVADAPITDLNIEANKSKLLNAKYIENYKYFKLNPSHSQNDSSMTNGSCTTIAMQMLLGYHNYYSDRRLIPAHSSDGKIFLDEEKFGDLSYWPDYDNLTEPANNYGTKYLGTEDAVYNELLDLTSSQMIPAVKNAAVKFVNTYATEIKDNVSISAPLFDANDAKSEIDAGRPIILGLDAAKVGTVISYHVFIAYGYGRFDGEEGFIAHYGRGSETCFYWVPTKWIGYCIKMSVNHEHNIYHVEPSDSDEYYACSECGYKIPIYSAFNYSFNGDVCTINGFKYSGIDRAIIPDAIKNRKIISISNLNGNNNLNYVNIPDSVTVIDANTFKDCVNLSVVDISVNSQLQTIYAGAFANCESLDSIYIPANVKRIYTSAFINCRSLKDVYFADKAPIAKISSSTFLNCESLEYINLPNTITKIENNAFENCWSLTKFSLPDAVTSIENSAFENCYYLNKIDISQNSALTSLGVGAFRDCSSLTTIWIPDGCQIITEEAFKNCSDLKSVHFSKNNTIKEISKRAFENCSNLQFVSTLSKTILINDGAFANCEMLQEVRVLNQFLVINQNAFTNSPKVFLSSTSTSIPAIWDNINVPIVVNCTISDTNDYVVSFIKSNTNPRYTERKEITFIREDYLFLGYYTGQEQTPENTTFDLSKLPNGPINIVWAEDTGCVAKGTLITLADGSQKAVEELTGNEMLLVWNMFTGEFDIAPILFIDRDIARKNEIIELHFNDGTRIKVISEHAFWDIELNKYVYLRNDAEKYIGHHFNKQTYDSEGNMIWTSVELIAVSLYTEENISYSPITYGHMCYYVNGMLSMPGGIGGLINIFEVNSNAMKYDEDAFIKDIETYGLYTYEEFAQLVSVSEEMFNSVNGQYLKVAIGKGILTFEQIDKLIFRYSKFFA